MALILVLIAFPSFKLLYLMDEVTDPSLSILAEGHQWYWSYQYPDFLTSDGDFIEFDSYLVPESDLEKGGLRMLEVDNRVIIPEITHTRFIVTSADVIHSFAIPSLGVKCDAYPGRLNQFSVLINRTGTMYGQCSEICGPLHPGMPIVVESLILPDFLTWLREQSLSMFVFGTIPFNKYLAKWFRGIIAEGTRKVNINRLTWNFCSLLAFSLIILKKAMALLAQLKFNSGRIGVCMLPITPLGMADKFNLLNKYIFEELFIMACFIFIIIAITILLMDELSDRNTGISSIVRQPSYRSFDLSTRLLSQLIHNNANPTQTLAYCNFPSNHPGHLDQNRKNMLVYIIRDSIIADQYRFASAVGKMYIKNTNRFPPASTDIIAEVLKVEMLT